MKSSNVTPDLPQWAVLDVDLDAGVATERPPIRPIRRREAASGPSARDVSSHICSEVTTTVTPVAAAEPTIRGQEPYPKGQEQALELDSTPHVIDNDVSHWFAGPKQPGFTNRFILGVLRIAAFVLASGALAAFLAVVMPALVGVIANTGLTRWVGESRAPQRPFPPAELAKVMPPEVPGYSVERSSPPQDLAVTFGDGTLAWLVTSESGVSADVVVGMLDGDEYFNTQATADGLNARLTTGASAYEPFRHTDIGGRGVYVSRRKQAPADQAAANFDFRYLYVPYKGTAMVVACPVEEMCRDVVRATMDWTWQTRVNAGDVAGDAVGSGGDR